ncbi:MAG: hypothetical protein EP344_04280 [Bacteroidetes bacterium]|nr:MAG: hypothetical protein EP344_04280 [Bacteroidota bacterium]
MKFKLLLPIFFHLFLYTACSSLRSVPTIPPGAAEFDFQDKHLNNGRPLKVLTYRPQQYRSDSPVLFVLHGASREAERYRMDWIPYAEQYNALLVVPYFAKDAGFPTSDEFNLGNMYRMDSLDHILTANPENQWSYSLLEPLFDEVRIRSGNRSKEYYLYGHSAGSQFVHRFMFFIGKNRVKHAVCANAGWYTVPDASVPFPYGLAGTNLQPDDLVRTFRKRVTVLLGDADTSTTTQSLRRTPEALRQGRHRFARGRYFYGFCKALAEEQRQAFNWDLQTVPGARHNNGQMAARAAAILFGPAGKP